MSIGQVRLARSGYVMLDEVRLGKVMSVKFVEIR